MSKCNIVDAFPQFLDFWKAVRHQPMDAQIDRWASEYMSQWPELLEKQVDDYSSEGEDWRQVAREKVFPFLDQRLLAMQAARDNLLASCASLYAQAQAVLGFESDISFVIYVGIGCGAGWVATYNGTPAVLFGLENVAECGWSYPPALTGMVAHEIGHIVHFHWRAERGLPDGTGPWWQLYTEGFAQHCEHLIHGKDTWHMTSGSCSGWLSWCHGHRRWLAAEFLRAVDAGESVRPFFGSWYDIQGRKQCGYFLGHELIEQLQASMSIKEIALLSESDPRLRRGLEELTGT